MFVARPFVGENINETARITSRSNFIIAEE
jgi:hypothetical protein